MKIRLTVPHPDTEASAILPRKCCTSNLNSSVCFEQAMRALPEDWKALATEQQEKNRLVVFMGDYASLLQATNRLAEAEPLMRRMVKIFLISQQNTGHPHPHLNAGIQNYHLLLQEMEYPEDQIDKKMADLGLRKKDDSV